MGRPKVGAKKKPLNCPGGRCYDDDSASSSDCSDSDCSDCYDCAPAKKRSGTKKSTSKSTKSKGKGKKKTTTRRNRDSSSCSCSDCMGYSSDDSFVCPAVPKTRAKKKNGGASRSRCPC